MIKLYGDEAKIECEICGKDVIQGSKDKGPGIIVIVENKQGTITDVIPCCKGTCDDKVSQSVKGVDGWKDVTEFTNPLLFMQNSMAFINNVQQNKFSEEAFEAYKKVLLVGYQYVLREPTDNEWEKYQINTMINF
ncbi:hypothetical protein [Paenibacillus gansuensis]|uniref:Uncharacterized protein n=1 Tax=Paenibacillus gansuensis TaxID=306542 RepID=A0ABW5PHR4_9BACL